jgi:hypothetical protein
MTQNIEVEGSHRTSTIPSCCTRSQSGSRCRKASGGPSIAAASGAVSRSAALRRRLCGRALTGLFKAKRRLTLRIAL